jgi:hypothetical protein
MFPAPTNTHRIFVKHLRRIRACKCALNKNKHAFVFVFVFVFVFLFRIRNAFISYKAIVLYQR